MIRGQRIFHCASSSPPRPPPAAARAVEEALKLGRWGITVACQSTGQKDEDNRTTLRQPWDNPWTTLGQPSNKPETTLGAPWKNGKKVGAGARNLDLWVARARALTARPRRQERIKGRKGGGLGVPHLPCPKIWWAFFGTLVLGYLFCPA